MVPPAQLGVRLLDLESLVAQQNLRPHGAKHSMRPHGETDVRDVRVLRSVVGVAGAKGAAGAASVREHARPTHPSFRSAPSSTSKRAHRRVRGRGARAGDDGHDDVGGVLGEHVDLVQLLDGGDAMVIHDLAEELVLATPRATQPCAMTQTPRREQRRAPAHTCTRASSGAREHGGGGVQE